MSDSHDNIANMEKALKYISEQGINFIIHCGDLAAPSMLSDVIIPNFKGQIYMVIGNVGDPDLLEKIAKGYKDVRIYGNKGEINIKGKKIGFCHFPNEAKQMAQSGQFDIVFYGHTHRPWEEKINLARSSSKDVHSIGASLPYLRNAPSNGVSDPLLTSELAQVKLVNPGTLAGMFYKATFAIYDTSSGKLELKLLEKI
ncbi:hypothetical protein A3F08_01020 [Candidatus Berkelbacteria bacterium RIFCSPHIGHO2_12_FULL_36_9]|uniref:Calcineurin-like phosphoesterase domain-containing protein n=1 Tax=Candidatus Berkelbacteria bacterium RIFCSPHIGHO2_12_FULL_36_9 TaxID=1797469 RepID=A0A1F5EF32_9BACT|nr:MAG: hypothetical protein A3F08_01020 [Candidatus Berkelbacteria bacterium RIFCSPHIGHO2_12_FULL_36_9]